VPHVELSVSGPRLARPAHPAGSPLATWASAVADSEQSCLVIDGHEVVVAISPPFEALLGLTQSPVGRPLLDEVLKLLDFGDGLMLDDNEIYKSPPLLALKSSQLARGLMRVKCANGSCTLDAVATPLIERGETTGSLTFFIVV
jgi:hypothetical protein